MPFDDPAKRVVQGVCRAPAQFAAGSGAIQLENLGLVRLRAIGLIPARRTPGRGHLLDDPADRAGVVVGRKDRITALRDARGILGGIVDPQNAYLLERGLKTLGLRVKQANETSMRMAEFLEAHPMIDRVWYPGLPSHPDHDIAKKQMTGFGGVVSFEVKGTLEETSKFIDALNLPYIAPSLGGVESLIEQPLVMSYYQCTPEDRRRFGIPDNMIRMSCGIENPEDLIADLAQALDATARVA